MAAVPVHPVSSLLSGVTTGPVVRGGALDMYPLLADAEVEAGYDLAGAAFAAGTLRVTEVSESGTVPTLVVVNKGPRPVLLLDGEELIGARQNRVLNVTVLVEARRTVEVPVSCVEAGRWRYRSAAFRDAAWLMHGEGRARKMRHVTRTLRQRGTREGDQHDVWNGIAEKAASMHTHSETGAHADMYEAQRAPLEREVATIAAVPLQRGALFAHGGHIVGLELFDAPATFRAMLPKLVNSFALDALDRGRRTTPRAHRYADADAFLAAVEAMPRTDHPAVALGTEFRLEGESLVGAGLAVQGHLVHLAVLAG